MERIPNEEILLVEYSATQDAYLHYDSFSWQVGAVLIAGTFIFWGLLLGVDNSGNLLIVGLGGCFISLLMSVWLLYTHHCRQIYLSKLDRIHEIEELLGMQQHRRWIRDQNGNSTYRGYGPSGLQLDLSIYLLTSIGTSVISFFKYGLNIWLGLPLIVVFFVSVTVLRNERMVKKNLHSRRHSNL